MTSDINKLLKSHQKLIHSELQKVASHIQRQQDEWFINTIMIDGIDVPFKYKRKKLYQSLTGQRVNMTYYLDVEAVAGFEMQVMRVVRIKVS